MPASKISFKENHLKLEVEGLECTMGPEIVKATRLSVELDVNDLLRAKLPALAEGRPDGIYLTSFGDKKIQVIKEVRGFTGIGLKEAKELVESLPQTIEKGTASEDRCVAFVNEVIAAGGHAEIVRHEATVPSVMDKLREMLTEALSTQDEG